ncbi:MAG: hypothetical protein QXR54_02220 [Nanopusillaceae archaeon]
MAKKKQISTLIDEKIYREIKEKGYKISELIEKGLEYVEKSKKILSESYIESIINKIYDLSIKLENIIEENTKNKILKIVDVIEKERESLLEKKIISRSDINRSFSKIIEEIERIFKL